MSSRRPIDEAKKGSAEIVILAIVEHESHHGYEIGKLIEARTGGSLRFTLASLYATLYRLEDRGWIKGRWIERAEGVGDLSHLGQGVGVVVGQVIGHPGHP